MSTDEGGWRWQIDVLRKQFPSIVLTSAFRNNSVTSSGESSYHARGRAVDVTPSIDIFNWIVGNFGTQSAEVIYSPAGNRQINNGKPHLYTGVTRAEHFSHVHWAIIGPTQPGTSFASAGIVTAGNPIPGVDAAVGVANFLKFISDPGTWTRIGLGIAGLVALGFAFRSLLPIESIRKAVAG